MKTIGDEQCAPITQRAGVVEAPLDQVADALYLWRSTLYNHVSRSNLSDPFPAVLTHLEPLIAGTRPREMLVEVGRWTAYFDCHLDGTDAVPVISFLAQRMGTTALAISSIPRFVDEERSPRHRLGSVKFTLFGPLKTDWLNQVRSVSVIHSGSRWGFDTAGTVQAFEEVGAYGARRVRDRFTSDMLDRYCSALGIDVFDVDAYGPGAVLMESAVTLPRRPKVMSLLEAQAYYGICPGEAAGLPG